MLKKYFYLVLASFLFLVACSQGLDQLDPNRVTTESFYTNAAELTSAVNAIYASVQANNLVAREYWFLQDLRSDDVASGGGQLETARNQLLIGTHDTNNSVMNAVWQTLFRNIHRANVVIDKAAQAKMDDNLKKRLVGEAKFWRAWSYFELVSLWGGVPLYTEFVKTPAGTAPRATADAVYQVIISDLKTAQTDLPVRYEGANAGRVASGAASAMLGKVYMHRSDYASARTELQKVISSGAYKLVDNYLDNFLEETELNAESVIEIGYSKIGDVNWDGDGNGAGNNETTPRSQEYAAIGWRNCIPSDRLINEFETPTRGDAKEDPRYRMSFYFVGDKFNNDKDVLTEGRVQGNTSRVDGTAAKVSWRKYAAMYKTADTYYTSGINMRLMRYSEVLLMAAECEIEAGNLSGAVTLMNQVRSRTSVAMPPYPTTKFPTSTKDQVFAALVHEKSVELGGEWVRNRDLLRWRSQNKLSKEAFAYFQKGKHELLPIPQQEIDNNDKVDQKDQNPGY
ncbi:MAG: RagB/SusD family nutrient uptake outer membrane protein [Cytophagales bacterium]|nr:MAG: RagB/SusD family nutrient uptake outer membrane protein [Cytophagales bacterium]